MDRLTPRARWLGPRRRSIRAFASLPSKSGAWPPHGTSVLPPAGAFIAPIDSDDLWHPEKIARQWWSCGPAVPDGLRHRVVPPNRFRGSDHSQRSGLVVLRAVFLRMLMINLVGNGSSLLIQRKAIEEIGGYETELRRGERRERDLSGASSDGPH